MGKAVRMISSDGTFTVMAIDSTDIVAEAARIHRTCNVASAALGRLLTGASMMGAVLKGSEDSVTLRINGGGPAGSVIAVSDSKGNVKGYIENAVIDIPKNALGKLDVGGAVGKDGDLTVMKDLGLKEPYIGRVPIVSGEIAEDITSYFALSEQTPTVCALGVLADSRNEKIITAGGFIIQLLPSAEDDTITKIEECLRDIPPVTTMFGQGMKPEEVCTAVLKGFELELLDEFYPEYKCDCSKERVSRALLTLGRDELLDMAKEPVTEVSCHFCNKKYRFSPADITALAQK